MDRLPPIRFAAMGRFADWTSGPLYHAAQTAIGHPPTLGGDDKWWQSHFLATSSGMTPWGRCAGLRNFRRRWWSTLLGSSGRTLGQLVFEAGESIEFISNHSLPFDCGNNPS